MYLHTCTFVTLNSTEVKCGDVTNKLKYSNDFALKSLDKIYSGAQKFGLAYSSLNAFRSILLLHFLKSKQRFTITGKIILKREEGGGPNRESKANTSKKTALRNKIIY